MIYFTSDLHLNHTGIIAYCNRPYAGAVEMNAAILARINETVGPKDELYIVGDFAFSGLAATPVAELFHALRCPTRHLIIGNHDEKNPAVLTLPWTTKRDLATVRFEGRRFVLCHYPMETWKSSHKGYLHLHGHSHGTLERLRTNRLDVGWDVHGRPLAASEFLTPAQARQLYIPVDGHQP